MTFIYSRETLEKLIQKKNENLELKVQVLTDNLKNNFYLMDMEDDLFGLYLKKVKYEHLDGIGFEIHLSAMPQFFVDGVKIDDELIFRYDLDFKNMIRKEFILFRAILTNFDVILDDTPIDLGTKFWLLNDTVLYVAGDGINFSELTYSIYDNNPDIIDIIPLFNKTVSDNVAPSIEIINNIVHSVKCNVETVFYVPVSTLKCSGVPVRDISNGLLMIIDYVKRIKNIYDHDTIYVQLQRGSDQLLYSYITFEKDISKMLWNIRSEKLINVHIGIPTPDDLDKAQLYMVKGYYEYWHYKHDGMNDKGWGCAYRSFQTICSWLLLQGHTEQQIPSHRDIQTILYKMGDKPATFVNSREWIGAIEIMMALDEYYHIQSKIINVNSGRDLLLKGRELADHFINNGCPIMIGGGVLAWTLLGVLYSEETGDIRFLILDPHYTGKDNLNNIQQNQWCAWFDISKFKEETFYNLCLPQIK